MKAENRYEPGDVISVPFSGVLRHYGVVTFAGRILSNNGYRGGVISQTVAEFSDGRPVRYHGQAGDTSPYLAHDRAHRHLGKDYTLTGANCIDYTRHARGQRATPWQVGRAVLMALGDMRKNRY
ncbi:MAG: hypothetical protein AAF829_06860 [Pseudomonadota bacterium]